MNYKVVALCCGLLCSPLLQAADWLIDVRTAEEYASDHATGAIQIDYQRIVSGVEQLAIPKDDAIYLYCHSGRRAGLAQQSLREAGYRQVENLGALPQAKQWTQHLAPVTTDH
jgi:phage shock protein E